MLVKIKMMVLSLMEFLKNLHILENAVIISLALQGILKSVHRIMYSISKHNHVTQLSYVIVEKSKLIFNIEKKLTKWFNKNIFKNKYIL